MHEGSKAFHALKLFPAGLRICGRWLIWAGRLAICSGGCSRVSLLRDDSLTLFLLDYVTWLVSQALGSRERVDKRFRFNSQQTFREALVQKTVACFADDEIGNLI